MNYTFYKKLKDLLNIKDKTELEKKVINEINIVCEKSYNSVWNGKTQSQYKFLKNSNKILRANRSKFRKFKLCFIKLKLFIIGKRKIRVVFFAQEYATFPTLMPVYDSMKKNKRFKCDLVHIPFLHPNKKYDCNEEISLYCKNGYSEIIDDKKYNLLKCSPDFAFYVKAYDLIPQKYLIEEIDKLVPKSIFIPYGMEIGSTSESMRYQFQLQLHNKAYKCISYCKKHYERAQKYSLSHGENYALIGHPRMDLITYDLSNNDEYQKIQSKINNRKVFMYNPHFTIEDGDNWGTFKEFGMYILQYFVEHKDLFLIYTPHPLLETSLEKEFSKKMLDEYHRIINKTSNIYYDKNIFYLNGVHLSDILISDASSIVPEFLTYNKPVIYTKKKNTTGFNNRDIEDIVYECTCKKDIKKNIEKLLNGEDIKFKKRNDSVVNVFQYNKDISVSQKIIDIVISSFNN